MSNEKDLKLSQKQQRLLSRYFDGECGAISAFFAKRLIARNPSADQFLQALNHTNEMCRSIPERQMHSVDLWNRIDARIEQETQASFYLGERRVKEERPALLERLVPSHVVLGGFSGAALATAALLVMYKPTNFITFSSPQPVAFNAAQGFQPVALGNSGAALPKHLSPPNGAGRMEVDWMRSRGSLALIPDSNGTSTIIWVKRRNNSAPTAQLRPSTQPIPLGRAAPTATISIHREWLDENTSAGAK